MVDPLTHGLAYSNVREEYHLTCIYRSNKSLPLELSRILEDKAHPQALDCPYDVAFPTESSGRYLMCWKTKRGEKCYEGM